MMASFLLLVLMVLLNDCYASPVTTNRLETTKPVVQPRWLIGFAQFIYHYTGRNPLDYNNYGCWCGRGNKGTNTVDEIDRCCKAHDACYENIAYLSFNWVCQDAPGTAAYNACMCDKTAAQCFAANTYNSYWKDRCQ